MEEEKKTEETTEQSGQPGEAAGQEEPKRRVAIAPRVIVRYWHKSTGTEEEPVECSREVFAVMDAIMERLSRTTSKEEMADILVSVHSVEDAGKSDPLPEGEERWEGPYMVGNVEVERMQIPDAAKALSSAILQPDVCLKGVERLAEQYFLRSRLDAFVQICVFDGVPAIVPLVNSLREIRPETFATMYRQMHVQAEVLRGWVKRQFPDMEIDWEHDPSEEIRKKAMAEKAEKARRKSGLVTPDGRPVEERQGNA